MTASTIPLLILIAFLWWRTRGEVLPVVLFTSIFDAASALNAGPSPISPWLLALGICLPIQVLRGKLRLKPVSGLNRRAFIALVLFVAYAVGTAVLWPVLFRGILVSNAHNGINQHLAPGITNVTQTVYLLAAFSIFLLAVHSTREQLRSAVDWYLRAATCVAVFSMWQLANAVAHVPYPSGLLYTNTAHVIYNAYQINGVWRLNSTLNEASEAAVYLGIGLALLSWRMGTRRIRWQHAVSFLLMLVALALTVSTVGYACLCTIAAGGLLAYLRYSFGRKGAAPVKVLLALGLAAAVIALVAFTNAPATVGKVFKTVFVSKVDSDSYRERTMWNQLALQTAGDSYYLGAGWGSVRASSFACGLLGNAGIPGALLLLNFLWQLIQPLRHPRHYVRYDLYEQSLFATAVVFVALLLAMPDPILPMIWVLFAVAVASKPRRAAAPAGRGELPQTRPRARLFRAEPSLQP